MPNALLRGFDCTENVGLIAGTKLRKANIAFVGRYYSFNKRKNLTLAEARVLAAHNIDCVSVFEAGAEGALGGSDAGEQHAQEALDQATATAQPPNSIIYFAVDFDPTMTQVNGPIVAYFLAINDVLDGCYRAGVYGSGFVCTSLKQHKLVATTWLGGAMGWRGSHSYNDWNIKQGLPGDPWHFGFQIDPDQAKPGDYGGWRPAPTTVV